jgi:hypothetical protein
VSKTFTLSEAQTLLPVLEALLRRAQASASHARGLEYEMNRLRQNIYLTGGMHVDVAAAARSRAEGEKAQQQMKDTLGEIDAIGVQVQNFEAGVLIFPVWWKARPCFCAGVWARRRSPTGTPRETA